MVTEQNAYQMLLWKSNSQNSRYMQYLLACMSVFPFSTCRYLMHSKNTVAIKESPNFYHMNNPCVLT